MMKQLKKANRRQKIHAVTLIVSICALLYAILSSDMIIRFNILRPLQITVLPISGWGIVQLIFSAAFWICAFNLAIRSRTFCLIFFLPIILDYIVYEYQMSTYGIQYRVIVEAAYGTTIEQLRTYAHWKILLLMSAIPASIILYIFWGYHAIWCNYIPKIKVLFLCFLLSIAVPFFLVNGYKIGIPDCHYQVCYARSEADVTPDKYYDTDYRRYWDTEHTADDFLPFGRIIAWMELGYCHFFPRKLQDCAKAESKLLLSSESNDVCIVLYVAESFRQDHSPFAGYPRNTLPLITQHYSSNVINLPHVVSFDTHTFSSMYGLMTDAEETRRIPIHNSFVSLFSKHGYDCFYVEHESDGASCFAVPKIKRLLEKDTRQSLETQTPEELGRFLDTVLNVSRRQFLFIEDGSGHWTYPQATGKVWGTSIIDKYDEARLEADRNLYELLRRIENRASIVLFVSDHGESLGEDGRYCHGGPLSIKEQRHSAAFIWYSNKYAEMFPDLIQELKNNAERFNSHDCIFHTMPSLGGIVSDVQNSAMNMTRRQSEDK